MMKRIIDQQLSGAEAGMWWLGQAGYIFRTNGITIAIDPYLSDSAAKGAPEFTRLYPPVIDAAAWKADIIIITHNHADHLDPETLSKYRYKNETLFIAPWLTSVALLQTGIPAACIATVNAAQTYRHGDTEITGVFALPTGADVLDTTGFLIRFANGRSVYHTSDTEYHPLVLAAAPVKPDVMLVPINGKWNNPGPEQAALFAQRVMPRYVFPNHYDTMALNAESPEVFKWFCENKNIEAQCIIAERMKPFIWK
jgi:L-ascorbate metabolism protein UlaG (beta-lactamase superfamily)